MLKSMLYVLVHSVLCNSYGNWDIINNSKSASSYFYKVCIRIMLYQQILSRATPKCVEQLKCGEQKYIEDILNDRWQHHIQRQVLGIFAVYNF